MDNEEKAWIRNFRQILKTVGEKDGYGKLKLNQEQKRSL